MSKVRRGSEAALDDWVRRQPSSYVARVARAHFFYWRAWDARGTGRMADVPKDRAREMRNYLSKAKTDLERSRGLTGKPYLSHVLLMSVARTQGDRAAEKSHYVEAVKLAPDSVNARLLHMRALEPRWGGSYQEMEDYLAESRREVKSAETIARLAARIPEFRGLESRASNDFEQSLRHYDEAIALYPSASARCERAYLLSKLKRSEEALKEVRLGLAAARDDRYCLDLGVSLAAGAADANEAIALLTTVIEVDLNSAEALNQRGARYLLVGKPVLALEDFKASTALGNARGALEVAVIYSLGLGVETDREEAEIWFAKAARTKGQERKEESAENAATR
jgi:tetratricopeptide (TPR) repeat protein